MMSNTCNFLQFFWSPTLITTEGRCCWMTLFLTALTGHFCKRCICKITMRRAERRFENIIQTPDATLRWHTSSAALQCLCCSRIIKKWKSILATTEDRSSEDDASRVRILTNIGILEEWQKKQVQVTEQMQKYMTDWTTISISFQIMRTKWRVTTGRSLKNRPQWEINEIGGLNLEKTQEKHKASDTLKVASEKKSWSVPSTVSEYGSLNIQKEDLKNVMTQNLQG